MSIDGYKTVIAVAVLTSVLLSLGSGSKAYTLYEIPLAPQAGGCGAYAINLNNIVTGGSGNYAFRWSIGQSSLTLMQPLPEPNPFFPLNSAEGWDINENLAVAGNSTCVFDSQTFHGVYWASNSSLPVDTDVSLTLGVHGEARGINNDPKVVGNAKDHTYATLWTPSAGLQDLNSYATTFYNVTLYLTSGADINNAEQVVGNGNDTGHVSHGFLLQLQNGGAWDLGTLFNTPYRISRDGSITGGDANSLAYLWIPTITNGTTPATAVELHSLQYNPKTGIDSGNCYGYGINDVVGTQHGVQVVGSSTAPTGGNHAVLWNGAGLPTDLNNYLGANSGWVLQTAYGINDNGYICGTGMHNGVQHGFVLVP